MYQSMPWRRRRNKSEGYVAVFNFFVCWFEDFKAKATNLLPAQADPPLNLNVPKPSFTRARTGSALGFQSGNKNIGADGAEEMGEGANGGKYIIRPLTFNILIFLVRTCQKNNRHLWRWFIFIKKKVLQCLICSWFRYIRRRTVTRWRRQVGPRILEKVKGYSWRYAY